MKKFFVFLAFLGMALGAAAQTYRVAPMATDSINVRKSNKIYKNLPVGKIGAGEEVRLLELTGKPDPKRNLYLGARIIHDGDTVICAARYLVASDSNDNALSGIDFSPNSFFFKFRNENGEKEKVLVNTFDIHDPANAKYYSAFWPVASGLMMLVLLIVCLLAKKRKQSASMPVVVLSWVLMACVSVIELVQGLKLGMDITWWYDPQLQSRLVCFLGCIPLTLFLMLQAYCGWNVIYVMDSSDDKNWPGSQCLLMGFLLVPVIYASQWAASKFTLFGLSPVGTAIVLGLGFFLLIGMITFTIAHRLKGLVLSIIVTFYWLGFFLMGYIVVLAWIRELLPAIVAIIFGLLVIGMICGLFGIGKAAGGTMASTTPSEAQPKKHGYNVNGMHFDTLAEAQNYAVSVGWTGPISID